MPNRVQLEIVDGKMKGRKFEFAEHDTFIFGRAPDCHAHLPDDTLVSRHHFILEVSPPLARLRDLGSLNATPETKLRVEEMLRQYLPCRRRENSALEI
jgi:pSer/pThr/pTyr-binding forkhead associated (FHA) protein